MMCCLGAMNGRQNSDIPAKRSAVARHVTVPHTLRPLMLRHMPHRQHSSQARTMISAWSAARPPITLFCKSNRELQRTFARQSPDKQKMHRDNWSFGHWAEMIALEAAERGAGLRIHKPAPDFTLTNDTQSQPSPIEHGGPQGDSSKPW